MVFSTVRSLGSSFTTFSYSETAFCNLPCCTYFSAAAITFTLLNPNPSAIRESTPKRDYKPKACAAHKLFHLINIWISQAGHNRPLDLPIVAGTHPKCP